MTRRFCVGWVALSVCLSSASATGLAQLQPASGGETQQLPAQGEAFPTTQAGVGQYEHMLLREPVAPEFLKRMTPEHEQYLGQLLDHWEKTSAQIKRLTCDYQRWDYDPTYCNWRDPNDNRLAAFKIARGKIQYGEPDQADSRSVDIWDFAGTKDEAGKEANYVQNTSLEASERWTCDGKAIYEYDFNNKKLYEVTIPAEMRGKALAQSPLPFLFGAKRADMQDRFWMQITTPPGVSNEYWIEAWPKRRDDAVNYHHVDIVISGDDFLPSSIHIYARDYDAAEKPVSHHFVFSNRRVNDQLTGLKDFFGVFIRPDTPRDWERIQLDRLQSLEDRSASASPTQPAASTDQSIDRR